jgi:hypothetical protein
MRSRLLRAPTLSPVAAAIVAVVIVVLLVALFIHGSRNPDRRRGGTSITRSVESQFERPRDESDLL